MDFKKNLRCVQGNRSPGGTVLCIGRKESTGEGLTPMIAKALRKKFEVKNINFACRKYLKRIFTYRNN